MTKRLFETFRSIYTDDSSISFEAYSPLGGLPSRVLRIGGRQVVDMGNYCNTCSLLFQHLADPAQRIHLDAFADHLASGVSKREMFHVLDTIYPVLPRGAYEVSLLEMTPRLIHRGSSQDYFVTDRPLLWPSPGNSGDPCIDYYRGMTGPILPDSALFEFVIPLYEMARLNPKVVEEYEKRMVAGKKPTAMAITLLDRRQPAIGVADDPPVTQHYHLAHYLIDGHHKLRAAANVDRPLTLLSFLAKDHCMASFSDVATVFRCLDL